VLPWEFDVWWWGIASTWFWIDPANDVVFIGMIQRRGGGRRQSRGARARVDLQGAGQAAHLTRRGSQAGLDFPGRSVDSHTS
jgi:CubicO group peptidase (beta-lactamase class C family)